jgi:HSP20 family protein
MRPERSFPEWVATLHRAAGDADAAASTGWTPPMDVLERADGLEVRMDLAGVEPETVHVAVRSGVLFVTGDKGPAGCRSGAVFHVAERTCGRFARSVPLRLAYDAAAIQAVLERGELRIVVPRLEDRRGATIPVPVEVR